MIQPHLLPVPSQEAGLGHEICLRCNGHPITGLLGALQEFMAAIELPMQPQKRAVSCSELASNC